MIVKFLLFITIFLIASGGSTWIMYKRGYSFPKNLTTKQDFLLLLYKLVLFSILVLVQFALLMLFGIDLFK